MKRALFLTVVGALLILGNGCSTFRALFSEPAPGKSRPTQTEKKKTSSRKKNSDYKSRRYSRDPLDALLFEDRARTEKWSENSNLTDAEKAALRHSLNPEDRDTRREIDKIYRENEIKRKKRQDKIFGPNPFRN